MKEPSVKLRMKRLSDDESGGSELPCVIAGKTEGDFV